MEKSRVKFYSSTDMVSGWHLKSIEMILENIDFEEELTDINDAIELFNIKKYIDAGCYLTDWETVRRNKYNEFSKKNIPEMLGKFCSRINNENLLHFVIDLDAQYYSDFWEMFRNFKTYKRIDGDTFKKVMKRFNIKSILRQKEIVDFFGIEITEEIMSSTENAVLLVELYLEKHDYVWKEMFLPKELDRAKKELLLSEYIANEDVNPNVIKLISQSQNSEDLPLSDEMIYEAMKKYQCFTEAFFEKNVGIEMPIEVSFCYDVEFKEVKVSGHGIYTKYSLQWIKDNLDFSTVLNNFIYLFEYTDLHMRCMLVGDKYSEGMITQLLGVKGKNHYEDGIIYHQFDALYLIQLIQYKKVLEANNVDILKVCKWFFETYLVDEFGVNNFELDIPSRNTTYLEKCKLLATSIERVLKQFNMYVRSKEINHELLEISSKPIVFKDIPSFIKNKYIYPNKNKIGYVFNSMFSEQSMLLYGIENMEYDYENCYELFLHNDIMLNDYNRYISLIKKLNDEDYIIVNQAGYLKPNVNKLLLIKDLFENNVSCASYLEQYKSIIAEMAEEDKVTFGSTLFSAPEQHYLNYIFNRSEFSNGLDLRNKYVHGSHAPASVEAEHQKNYYIFLRTLIFIIIKINEEFCLRERLESEIPSKEESDLN